jgi:c-di-GMP-binding flagellar brake protein YcgR
LSIAYKAHAAAFAVKHCHCDGKVKQMRVPKFLGVHALHVSHTNDVNAQSFVSLNLSFSEFDQKHLIFICFSIEKEHNVKANNRKALATNNT